MPSLQSKIKNRYFYIKRDFYENMHEIRQAVKFRNLVSTYLKVRFSGQLERNSYCNKISEIESSLIKVQSAYTQLVLGNFGEHL